MECFQWPEGRRGVKPRLYDLRLGVSLLARSPAIESVVVGGATSSFEIGRIA